MVSWRSAMYLALRRWYVYGIKAKVSGKKQPDGSWRYIVVD